LGGLRGIHLIQPSSILGTPCRGILSLRALIRRCARSVLSIGVFAPETAIVEDDLAALNVIAKPEAPPAEAVLAVFRGRHPYELQDIVLAASVIRVITENGERLGINGSKFWMLPSEAT
jgi:hypothetical protein